MRAEGNAPTLAVVAFNLATALITYSDSHQYQPERTKGTGQVVVRVAYGIAATPYCGAAVQGNCFDDQTELLTDQGWKKFPQVTGKERALTLNGDAAEWGPIVEVIGVPFDGYLNLHDGDRVNFCITNDHLLLVRSRKQEYRRHSRITAEQGRKIKEARARGVPAGELAGQYGVSPTLIYMIAQGKRDHAMVDQQGGPRWRLVAYQDLPDSFIVRRTNGWGGGSNPDTITFVQESSPGRKSITYTFDFEDWARFLGWYVAEGWTYVPRNADTYRIGVAQTRGEKYEEIAALLTRMGVTFGRYNQNVSFSHYAIGRWLREHCGVGSGEKRIPACIKEAPSEIIEAFLDAYTSIHDMRLWTRSCTWYAPVFPGGNCQSASQLNTYTLTSGFLCHPVASGPVPQGRQARGMEATRQRFSKLSSMKSI